jgi:hypothetical protein
MRWFVDGAFFLGDSRNVKDHSIDDDLGSAGQGDPDLPIKKRLQASSRADFRLRPGDATAPPCLT